MHAEDQRDFEQTSRVQLNDKREEHLVIAFLFSRCLYFLVLVSIKDTNHNGLVMNLEEDNRFIRVWLLYMSIRKKMEV